MSAASAAWANQGFLGLPEVSWAAGPNWASDLNMRCITFTSRGVPRNFHVHRLFSWDFYEFILTANVRHVECCECTEHLQSFAATQKDALAYMLYV